MNDRDTPWRRAVRLLSGMASFGLAMLILGGLVGQALRDRTAVLALLSYIPLPLVGSAALGLDGLRRGRSIRRFRFGLLAMGLAGIAWSAWTLLGSGAGEAPRPGDREVSVLQWNVHWGGGLFRSPLTWASQRGAIARMQPDLIVLNEAPPETWLDWLRDDLGPSASIVGTRREPETSLWYGLAIGSRWPLRLERRLSFPGGTGLVTAAEVRGVRLRLLLVDGLSTPTRSRLPFLQAVAATCREAEREGRPIDLVLGDFNTPSRSVGFDELEALGYRLAGRSADGWRGTFPRWIPLYDIDHVWLGAALRLASCTFFSGPCSDHRGQLVRVLIPKEPRE